MKKSVLSVNAFVLLILLLSGCAPTSEPIPPTFTSSPEPSTLTPEPTPAPTMTPTLPPSPTVTATPIGGSGILLFDRLNTGFFTFDLGAHTLTVVDAAGFTLDIKENRFLFAQDGQLITANLDGSAQNIVAQNLSGEHAYNRAFWIPETDRILFIGRDQGQDFIYSVRGDGTDLKQITQQGMGILGLYKTNSSSIIVWEEGIFAEGFFSKGIWHANVDGSNQELLDIFRPVFSPSGDRFVARKFINVGGVGMDGVFIMESDLSGEIQLINPLENQIFHVQDYYWVDGGNRILIQGNVCDPICDELHHFIYSESGSLDREVKIPDEMYFGKVSPDGLQIAYMTYQQYGEVNINLIDLITFIITPLDLNLSEGEQVINLMWLH